MSEISAGAITYTMKDHVPFYLLIKDFHGNYGFAKGHLEKGETETQAAIREIKEEVDEICLLSYEEAMNLLSFDNMKGVLVKADQYLKNHYEQKSLTDH